MRIIKSLFSLLCMVFFTGLVQAQGKTSAFGETMRSNGRIYVVIAVILTILIGLFLYLIRLDRKIGKAEKETI